jgi:demethylmenaquinone methyltransferase/2-methoxy-6-polyprenyl-1,4-benzoquinol methylase
LSRRFPGGIVARVIAEAMGVSDPAPAVEPHPVLAGYYAGRGERGDFVRGLFDRTARHYDAINRAVSLGTGGWYRRRILKLAGLKPGLDVLDVAVGTGLLARQARRLVGADGRVIGLDLSAGMLAEARTRLAIPLVQARAEALPIGDATVDVVALAYGLRHLADLTATFGEFRRVLRPGGILVIIEMGRPRWAWYRRLVRLLLGRIVPALCRWLTADAATQLLMRYYWDTVEHCVPGDTILQAMADAGFADAAAHSYADLLFDYVGRTADAATGAGPDGSRRNSRSA